VPDPSWADPDGSALPAGGRVSSAGIDAGQDPTDWAGSSIQTATSTPAGDLSEVVGQPEARAALAIAAAGGHHLFLLGPPGAGKSMLAARLPGLLPDLSDDEALEVTAIHSVAGTLGQKAKLHRRPPYEDPHHTTTPAALIGGGSGIPRPGAASRAHRGVLFLDEAPEFDGRVLDSLRQPLEQGELVIHRSQGSARFPARFMMVLAANPCPCGRASQRGLTCTCTPAACRRYLGRLSGPLLDRVDLQVHLLPVSRAHLDGEGHGESTAVVAARVAQARAAQSERWAGTGWTLNGHVPGPWLRGPMKLPRAITADLDQALDRGLLSVRGYDRALRVAWTAADLGGRVSPDAGDTGLALTLRRHAGFREEPS
jgi:magnesium chelatase family protein